MVACRDHIRVPNCAEMAAPSARPRDPGPGQEGCRRPPAAPQARGPSRAVFIRSPRTARVPTVPWPAVTVRAVYRDGPQQDSEGGAVDSDGVWSTLQASRPGPSGSGGGLAHGSRDPDDSDPDDSDTSRCLARAALTPQVYDSG